MKFKMLAIKSRLTKTQINRYIKEIEPMWDEEKGIERQKRVNRIDSFRQISHRNCRRYWEILSVSQELSINTHCCRRNTWEAGTWCYFFIIGATCILFFLVKRNYDYFQLEPCPPTFSYYEEGLCSNFPYLRHRRVLCTPRLSESYSPMNTSKSY